MRLGAITGARGQDDSFVNQQRINAVSQQSLTDGVYSF